MLLDDQFNYVSDQSGARQVGSAGVLTPLNGNLRLHHSGYLYIWVSNETQNWDVFFDNLSIVTYSGPMLEEDHYYPFGLTMAGISDKALKSQYATNKYRYNGKELQNQEFSDGTGLEEYDYGARMQDPQIGRGMVPDPAANEYQSVSVYTYGNNNPLINIDVAGKYAVSVHYDITYGELIKLGYSKERADLIAHYASTYSDHPTENVIAVDAYLSTGMTTMGFNTEYRKGIDYSKTAESQDEKNS